MTATDGRVVSASEPLAVVRRAVGLTQEELAERTGLSARSISNIERGLVRRPHRRSLLALAAALGLSDAETIDFVDRYRRPHLPASLSVRPAQLPAPPALIGRDTEIAAMDGLFAGSGRLLTLDGMAGVGKTSLAVYWAHRVRDRFRDGQLYANLHGYGPVPASSPAQVLEGFLRALGVPGPEIPPDLDARAALFRSTVADRRLLLLLDNARSDSQVRPLLPGAGASVAVVTSRSRLRGLGVRDGAYRIGLDPFTPAEARAFLGRIIGGTVTEHPEPVAEIVRGCAGLPLALSIAGETVLGGRSLPDVAAALGPGGAALQMLSTEDESSDMTTVLSWSYQALSPPAAHLFRLLGLHPGADVDVPAAAALGGLLEPSARRVLAVLVDAHLLERRPANRYGFHDLVQAYAAQLVARDPRPVRRAAMTRLFDSAVARVRHATELFAARIEASPAASASGFTDAVEALSWLDHERAALVALAGHGAEHGWPGHTIDLAWMLSHYLQTHAHFDHALALHGHALAAAERGGDLRAAARARAQLGIVHCRSGRFAEAQAQLIEAVRSARAVPDPDVAAVALNNLGIAALQVGRYPEAAGHLGASLVEARKAGNLAAEGRALSNLGLVEERRGNYREATAYYQRCLQLARSTGDRNSEATALHNLGNVHRYLGDHGAAVRVLTEALALSRVTGYREAEGYSLTSLGLTCLATGDLEQARRHQLAVLSLAADTGIRSLEALALNGLGETSLAENAPHDALAYHLTALDHAAATREPAEQARAHDGAANAYARLRQPERARAHWREAWRIYRSLGTRKAEGVRAKLTARTPSEGR